MSISLLNGLDSYGNLADVIGGNESSQRPDPNLDLLSPETNNVDPNAAGARTQTAAGVNASAGSESSGSSGGNSGGYSGGGFSGGFSKNNFPPAPTGSGRGQLLDIAA